MEATPAAVDDDRPVVVTLDARSHRFHGGQRGGHVGPVREAVDDRGPLGERAEEDRTVGDRLLAGCADGAAAGSAAVDDEDAWRSHDSCSARARYPEDSTATVRVSASAPSTTRISTPRSPSAECAISMS